MILSASRRTDIPSFYSEWFMNRLKAGYAFMRNPMNHAQVSRVPLSAEVVDCIVFWTKDPANIMDKLIELDEMGYKYYFQFTLTPYETDIERNLRPKSDIITTFRELSSKIGKEKVIWRYDPIILNSKFTLEYHDRMFYKFCEQLHGFTNTCTISFVDLYPKLNKAVKSELIRGIQHAEMIELAKVFSETAKKFNIELRTCSEELSLLNYGITQASCIDKALIEKICGYQIDSKADAGQRQGCGCIQSIDIGTYNTCKNGCIYCYANYSDVSVAKNCLKYNPNSAILADEIQEDDKITNRKVSLLKKNPE